MSKTKSIVLVFFFLISTQSFGQASPFTGTWEAKYNLVIDGNDTTKIELADHQQFLVAISAESYDMYYSGNKVASEKYEINNEVLTLEGIQLTKVNRNTIHQTDVLGKTNFYLKKTSPPEFDDIPEDLLEVWIGESKFLTNTEGDTVDYTSDNSGYSNNWTVAFTETGKMYSYLPGSVELYSSDYRLKNDTLFFVKPFQIGEETYYDFGKRYYVIRQLNTHSLVYGEDNLGDEFLNGFRKAYSRTKSTFNTTPEEIIGSWSGAYSYLMEKDDTIRMYEPSSFLGIKTEARAVDTTNTEFYQFLPNNTVKFLWKQDALPVEFKFEIKDNTLKLYKFPLYINGEEKYVGLDAHQIEVLTNNELTIRKKLDVREYRLKTYLKSDNSEAYDFKHIIGLKRDGQKVGVWGNYHKNNCLKQITYYWDSGFPRLELNFDINGKYIESEEPDKKVIRLKNSISITDAHETYLLLLKVYEDEKPSHIEFHREGKLLISIDLNENSEIVEKKWFDLGLAKYRDD